MALKEVAACAAGHEQTYVRRERPGRCTRCGGPLNKTVYDDALPMGRTVTEPGTTTPRLVVEDAEEASDGA